MKNQTVRIFYKTTTVAWAETIAPQPQSVRTPTPVSKNSHARLFKIPRDEEIVQEEVKPNPRRCIIL